MTLFQWCSPWLNDLFLLLVDIFVIFVQYVLSVYNFVPSRDGEILCMFCVFVIGHAAEETAVKGVAWLMMAVHHRVCVCDGLKV